MISKEEKVLYHDNGNLININGINYIKQSAKEEIRAERDREIIDLINNSISPDTHGEEMVMEQIIELIEENK